MSDSTQTTTTTITTPNAQTVDANFDGIPDSLQTFLTESDFRSDWTNRRKVIFNSLLGLGCVFVLVALATLYSMIAQKTVDITLAGIVSTLLWVIATSFIAIMSAYIGGAQLDVNNFRSSLTDMVGKLTAR